LTQKQGILFAKKRGFLLDSNNRSGQPKRSALCVHWHCADFDERMPGDNAWSESFFATMKKKLIHWANYGRKSLYGRQCLSIFIAFTM